MVDYKFKKKPRGTHCSKGHEFTEENTFIRTYDNARVCRECRKQYAKEKYQRNKEKNGGVARPRKDKLGVIEFDIPDMSPEAKLAWQKLNSALRETITPCIIAGPEWYADRASEVTVDKAEEMCYNCPLLKLCYDYAVADNVKAGIWGGVIFEEQEETLFDI